MPDSLMPGARQVHAARDGGSMVGGPPRVTWHTTEYGDRAIDVAHDLNAAGTQVHLVWQPRTGETVQLVSAHRAGRGLENDPGGVQTNRMGRVNIQIEVVAHAADPFTNTPMHGLDAILTWLDSWGIPREWPSGRPGGNEMFGPNPQRSVHNWTHRAGHYGHSQVPENCVSADTPILCADLTWRPAGELLPGDELIGFDEESTQKWGRLFRPSVVTNNAVTRDALLRVNTPQGTVRCNYQHPWLTKRGWVKARDLRPGDEAWWFGPSWETDRSWEAGWLAGMYDGEGCLSIARNRTTMLVVSQRESPTAEEMARLVKERADGVSVVHRAFGPARTDMVQVQIGSRWESMRMLGTVRPQRLLATSRRIWEDGSANRTRQFVPVESVEPWGTGLIASLETSTSTYIAAGFAMHNSHWDPGHIDIDALLAGGDDVSAKDVIEALESKRGREALFQGTLGLDRIKSPNPDNPQWSGQTFLRATLKRLEAQNSAIGEMAKTIGELGRDRGQAVDVDALVDRVEAAIESIDVRLDVEEESQS